MRGWACLLIVPEFASMNECSRITTGHTACPHECLSTCAIDMEVIAGSHIIRVHGGDLED